MYTYTHSHMCTHTCAHICTSYVHICTHTLHIQAPCSMHAHMWTHMHTTCICSMHAYMNTHKHAYCNTRTMWHTCNTHAYSHVCTLYICAACMHTHIHTHVHTHAVVSATQHGVGAWGRGGRARSAPPEQCYLQCKPRGHQQCQV